MLSKKRILPPIVSSACLILLMLDPAVALNGASVGIEQCLHVIIPSLFPFFFLSIYLNSWLLGLKIPILHWLGSLLHIPGGGDSILLLGLIGGYPVGAQAIANAYRHGTISRNCAHILLGYCNNAGPAFIFGVASSLFSSSKIAWVLWFVQLCATIITGLILPKPNTEEITWCNRSGITAVEAMQRSLRSIASVCGWIILFKILLSYISKYTQSNSPLLSGILELSNGCLALSDIASESIKLILCSVFLSFGGICVMMQTKSAVAALGLGYYLQGKIIQTSISCLLSLLLSYILFSNIDLSSYWTILIIVSCICSILLITHAVRKKLWNFITL